MSISYVMKSWKYVLSFGILVFVIDIQYRQYLPDAWGNALQV